MDNKEFDNALDVIPAPEMTSVTAVEAMERANIDMQIATAQRYPKHSPKQMSMVKANMLTLATMDEETAASCFYTLPRGGKAIQGESVRLAEIALSCYGNMRILSRIIEICPTGQDPHVVVQAIAHDLEANVVYSAENRRRITKKKGKDRPDEDDINLATNACSSIAGRNAILKVIPKAIVRPVMLAAKRVAVGDVKSLASKRNVVIDRLKAMGASQERILAVVGCSKPEDVGINELETLIGLGTALKDGDTSLEEAFPPIAQASVGVAGLKEKLSAATAPVQEPEAKAEVAAEKPVVEQPKEYRYLCNNCSEEFDEPRGRNKLCPKCLSNDYVDRLAST